MSKLETTLPIAVETNERQSRAVRARSVRIGAARAVGFGLCALVALGALALDLSGALGVSVLTPSAQADEPAKKTEKPKVDAASVYFGSASSFHQPAEVDTDSVWAEIPEYKKIVEDELEAGTARYELLMEKASRRFSTAVRKAARTGSYDLVARSGSVENVADVPDITQDVIDLL